MNLLHSDLFRANNLIKLPEENLHSVEISMQFQFRRLKKAPRSPRAGRSGKDSALNAEIRDIARSKSRKLPDGSNRKAPKGTKKALGAGIPRKLAVLDGILESFKSCRGHHSPTLSWVPSVGKLIRLLDSAQV